MSTDREDRIRRRAHELWERDGRPEGHETEHWQQAEREIDQESTDRPRSGPAPGGGGVSTGLQPGGTTPAGGPGKGFGSEGTGGGSTGGARSGSLKRGDR